MSDLLFAREALNRLLLILSAIVGIAVVATGAFRSAILAQKASTSVDFPATNAILYGLLFTSVLALLYMPTYADLRESQKQVRDMLCQIPEEGIPSAEWYLARDRVSTLLKLHTGPIEAIRTAIAVSGPLLGALSTLFLTDLKS